MKKAFTLVELAIVIVIIGLLVGGVLVGQELIKQAKIQSFVKKLNQVNGAVSTFYAKYGFLPGDLPSAKSSQFFGVTGGNGNGQLCSHNVCSDGVTNESDSYWSWYHLHISKMMSLAMSNGNTFDASTPASGITPYYAKFRDDRGGGSSYDMFGMMMLITGDFVKTYHNLSIGITNIGTNISIVSVPSGVQAYSAFTGDEASAIDTKIDDGNALTGKLRGPTGYNPQTNSVTSSCHTNGVYVVDDKNYICRILFETNVQ